MTPELVQRYQPGGDLYLAAQSKWGVGIAGQVAAAAARGDNDAVLRIMSNAAREVRTGEVVTDADYNTRGFGGELGSQLYNEPFDAPLDQAGNVLKSTLESGQENIKKVASTWLFWVIGAALIAGVVLYFGGLKMIKGKFL